MAGALGEFEQLVLWSVLRLGELAYGVTIRETIEDRTGRDVSAGAVYTTLARLQKRGLVSSRVGEQAPDRSGMRRRYYAVKPAGASLLLRSYRDIGKMADGFLAPLAGLANAAPPERE